jgi:alpha-N-arabinofuranosidase
LPFAPLASISQLTVESTRYANIQNNTLTGKLEDTDWNAPKNQWGYWIGSVAEAIYLLGAERNGDRIWGTTYAPLLQNLNNYQWAVRSTE